MSDLLTCYAHTMPGVEKIAWIEIRQRLPRVKFLGYRFAKDQNGIVQFACAGALDDLLSLRTVEDVFLHAMALADLSRDWRDLRRLAREVSHAAEFEAALQTALSLRRTRKRLPTYRVVARQFGAHQYRRKDLQEAFIRALGERYARKLQYVEEGADLELWINLLGSELLCGVRLSDETMRHRAYQVAHLPASLRPSVAAAMALLTGPDAHDAFIDPMCGSGTLLIERALAGPSRFILGGDIALRHTHAARQNLDAAEARAALDVWDAGALPLASTSVDKLATNLPFGKQIGSPEAVARLYPRFFAEVERILKPGGRAVVLSSEFDLIKRVLRERPHLQITTGYSIAVLGQWGRIYLIDRK